MLERVGFEELLRRWPVGDWSNDEKEELIGRMRPKIMEKGWHGMSLGARLNRRLLQISHRSPRSTLIYLKFQ